MIAAREGGLATGTEEPDGGFVQPPKPVAALERSSYPDPNSHF